MRFIPSSVGAGYGLHSVRLLRIVMWTGRDRESDRSAGRMSLPRRRRRAHERKTSEAAGSFCLRSLQFWFLLRDRRRTVDGRNRAREESSVTTAEAQKFIEDAEQRLFDLEVKASRAASGAGEFHTDDTEQIAAEAGEALNTASTKYAKEAHRLMGCNYRRSWRGNDCYWNWRGFFRRPDDPKAQKELAQIQASLEGDYGKGNGVQKERKKSAWT